MPYSKLARFPSLVVLVLAGLVLTCLPVQAAGSASLLTQPTNISVNPGSAFSLDVDLNPNGEKVSGAEVDVNFDPAILQIQSINQGGLMSTVLAPGKIEEGKASITLGSGPTSPVTTTGTLATVTFKAIKSGSTSITLNNSQTASLGRSDNSLSSLVGSTIIVGDGSTKDSTNNSSSSTVVIFAAGQQGGGAYPNMDLEIYDKGANAWKVVKTWNNVNGNYTVHPYPSGFTYTSDYKLTHDQIRVGFINDFFGGEGNDRNLYVDKVVLDGVSLETNDNGVYSTGTWDFANGCNPGNKKSNILHCNGYFRF